MWACPCRWPCRGIWNVLGFDINAGRIAGLAQGHDRTREVSDEGLRAATVRYTSDPADLAQAAVIIVAVPTPIDDHRSPDLTPVVGATTTVGRPYVQRLRGGL